MENVSLGQVFRAVVELYDKGGSVISQTGGNVIPLKYGELMANAAAYARNDQPPAFELINPGKNVGFVNHLDVLAAARFMAATDATGIFKHTGVCGAAYRFSDPAEEYRAASEVDEVARFGGIIGTPRVTKDSAIAMVGPTGKRKVDGVVAFEYEEGAVEHLLCGENSPLVYRLNDRNFDLSRIDIQQGVDGLVLQERIPPPKIEELHLVAGENVSPQIMRDLLFGFMVADTRHSNAICFVQPLEEGVVAAGIGGGTSDRITAAYQAMEKAVAYNLFRAMKDPLSSLPDQLPVTLYMTSDGFFPDAAALKVSEQQEISSVMGRSVNFPYQMQRDEFLLRHESIRAALAEDRITSLDKMKVLAEKFAFNVPVVLTPGGSKNDDKVIQYASERGMTMLFPMRGGEFMRCFKHGSQSAFAVR